MLLTIIAAVAGLVSLVCWIVVLIAMFQESVVQGIIGLICGLWAFIWGWQHRDEGSIGKVMPIWTIAFIAGVIVNVVSRLG